MDFGVRGIKYVTLSDLSYKGINIPKGFEFDGVTVKAPFSLLLSSKDMRQGIRASCFHDWLCLHKDVYGRKYATNILVEIWHEDGLNTFKAWIVKISVNLFQFFRGWL